MKRTKIALFSISLLAAGCSTPAPKATLVLVPEALRPGAGEVLSMVVPARGDQVYECRDSKWAFVAPEAALFDTGGKRIGRHYAGPHWEASDGSKVVAVVKQRADAPEAGSIPWLLLGAKSVGPAGAFSKVTSIQRVATKGGIAPAGGCAQAGQKVGVPYTADYYFFTAR